MRSLLFSDASLSPRVSTVNDTAVRRVVRDKIADGSLPRDRVGAVRATNGTNETCDVCSAPVSSEEVLYKIARQGSRAFVFHATCFAIWRDERNNMSSGPAVLSMLLAGIHWVEGVLWLSIVTLFISRLRSWIT